MSSTRRESLRSLKSPPSQQFTEQSSVSGQTQRSCSVNTRVSCRVSMVDDPLSIQSRNQHISHSALRPNSLKLRHAARCPTTTTTTSSASDSTSSTDEVVQVELPSRYQHQISLLEHIEKQQLVASDESLSWAQKEHDLGLAITWIQQQIRELKQQDRVIIRQLLELRANIHNRPGSTVRKRHSFTVDSPDVATRSSMYQQQLLSVQTDSDSPVSRDDILERFRDRASMEQPPTHTDVAAAPVDGIQGQCLSRRVSASTGQLVQLSTACDSAFKFTSDELFV